MSFAPGWRGTDVIARENEAKQQYMKKVHNKNRKFGSAQHYYHARLDGVDYLFTEEEKDRARKRSTDNREDLPKRKWRWHIEDVIFLVVVLSTFASVVVHYLLTNLK